MRAAIIEKYGEQEIIKIANIEKPSQKDDEILLKVEYAAVNPVDIKICQGFLKDRMPNIFPIILGWDAAGTIESVGKNIKRFRVGDKIAAYCRKETIHDGTFAEYICINEKHAAKLKSLQLDTAASLPLASLTAWQSLNETVKIKKNDKVLIHAGSGGVGSMAIQFAKLQGATVYTTTSKNKEYVKKLGADYVFDHKVQTLFADLKLAAGDGFDIVYDTIGNDTYEKSAKLLKKGGVITSILYQPMELRQKLEKELSIKTEYLFVRPDSDMLQHIINLVETGKVQPSSIKQYTLNNITKAFEEQKAGHVKGKLVIKI